MNKPCIISKEFLEALEKELRLTEEVIQNYDEQENQFELDDYQNYLADLQELKDWTILE